MIAMLLMEEYATTCHLAVAVVVLHFAVAHIAVVIVIVFVAVVKVVIDSCS